MITSQYDSRHKRIALTVKVGVDDYATVKGARPVKGATQALISTLYARFAASLRLYGESNYDQIAAGSLELVTLPESCRSSLPHSEPSGCTDGKVLTETS